MCALNSLCRTVLKTNLMYSYFAFSKKIINYCAHSQIRCFVGRTDFSINNPSINKYVESLMKEYKNLNDNTDFDNEYFGKEKTERIMQIRPIYEIYCSKMKVMENLNSLQELTSDDSEMQKLVEEERQSYTQLIEKLDQELLEALLSDSSQNYRDIIMEITAGVGGQEAMLFAKELYDMYISYVNYKGWYLEISDSEKSDIGGLRHGTLFISGDEAFRHLKHEAGVHRVQRVPFTEKSGRVHTSTVTVSVLPQPEEVDIVLNDSDLCIETKRASGAGGQHVNKTDSAVRITHLPTGISVECQVDRSQIKNRKQALQKLRARLYQIKIDEQRMVTDSTRKQQVKSSLRSEKIRTYNYSQDRITDHRIGRNLHNLHMFMDGSESLDSLINDLEVNFRKEMLLQKIADK